MRHIATRHRCYLQEPHLLAMLREPAQQLRKTAKPVRQALGVIHTVHAEDQRTARQAVG